MRVTLSLAWIQLARQMDRQQSAEHLPHFENGIVPKVTQCCRHDRYAHTEDDGSSYIPTFESLIVSFDMPLTGVAPLTSF